MGEEKQKRVPLLDPIHRVSEIIFGLIMALTFTGTLSAATAGREEIRTMMFAALGCNLAWGMVDAAMYLMTTLTERARYRTLFSRLCAAPDTHEAHSILADALSEPLCIALGTDGLEHLRQRLAVLPASPTPGKLIRNDYVRALGVFLLVVLATFPVVIPFILIRETLLAMRISNAVALGTLFAAGYTLGRHAGITPWRYGMAVSAIGAALVLATIALGG